MTEETKKVEAPQVEAKTEAPKAAPTTQVVADKKPEQNTRPNNNNNRGPQRGGPQRGGPRRNNNRRNGRRQTEFEERVVDISRVVNVVKGGRRFSFSTLVVIGDKKGRVAYGHGKAKEVPSSIKKAIKDARRNLIKTPLINGTVPHITQAKYISSNILLKPAPKGKGIIASGAVRAVVELAGYTDIVTKSLGSNNKTNTVKATLRALEQLRTVEEISALRGKDVS